jgi:thiol-disulfide isomerase/thioredoxin
MAMKSSRSLFLAAFVAASSVSSIAVGQAPLLSAGAVAPDFVSRDAGGREVRLADFKGKVVVLDFWATWCGPCLQSLPHVQEVAQAQKGNGVVVLAVCTSDTRAKFDAWLKDNAAKYPDVVFTCELHDRGSKLADERAAPKLYHVEGLPTKFVIGKDGRIALTIVGLEADDVRLEAGLLRAGVPIDAAVGKRGEEQVLKVAKEDAEAAAEAAAHPPLPFFVEFGALKAGAPLPAFTAIGADGKEFTLAALRGKPAVIAMAFETLPAAKLQELAQRYGGYGVQAVGLMVFTPRTAFDTWAAENNREHTFLAAVDPVGKYTPTAGQIDPKAQLAHHKATIVGKLFGDGMYPAMPIGLAVDAEGRLLGGFHFGKDMQDGVANLLLHAGVKLKAEDMPKVVAPADAFAIKPLPAPTPPEAVVAPIAVGAVAPDFASQDHGKATVRLADFKGKVVVLDFWATWCGPCKASMPHTQAVAAKYRSQGVVVLASCTNDGRKEFEAWLQKNQGDCADIVFTHDKAERSPERASHALYGVTGIPMQFVIGRDGVVASIVEGYTDGEVLLEAALAKAGIEVDAATLAKAAADQHKRDDARKKNATVPAIPLRRGN